MKGITWKNHVMTIVKAKKMATTGTEHDTGDANKNKSRINKIKPKNESVDTDVEDDADDDLLDEHIIKVSGGYKLISKSTGKNLGGPYKTMAEAKKRERQVQFFKHQH